MSKRSAPEQTASDGLDEGGFAEDGASQLVLCYVTAPSRDAALEIARTVIGERLAACANVLPAMTSIYHWKGQILSDDECVLLFKTRRGLAAALSERIVALHSYECPCVVFVPIVAGSAPYLDWLLTETVPRG